MASTGFFVIRKTTKDSLKPFLMFLVKTKILQELLIRLTSGAIMPSINESNFLNFKIPLLEIQ
nr:hypothetical protein [Helicobacter apodemus]